MFYLDIYSGLHGHRQRLLVFLDLQFFCPVPWGQQLTPTCNHQSSIISHIILPGMPTRNGAHPHVGLPHHLPLLHALDSIWQSAWYYCYDTWVIVIKKESILDLGSTCTRKKRWKLFQKYPITPLTFYQSLDCMYRVVMTDFGSMAPMVAEIEPNMTIVWGNGPG